MIRKPLTIAISDRFDQQGDTLQSLDDRRAYQVTRLLRDFGKNSVTRLSLDETGNGLLMVGADNDGALRVPELTTFFDIRRAFENRPGPNDLPTPVSPSAIPFAAFLLTM